MRRLVLALCVAVPVCLAADAEPEPEPGGDAKSDLKKMQGTWSIVKGTKAGMAQPKEMMSVRFTFEKDQIRLTGGPGGGMEPTVTFTLNAKKSPPEIDIQPPMGEKPVKGLYKLNKDELILVFNDPGQDRPAKLDDAKATILVLKRDKK